MNKSALIILMLIVLVSSITAGIAQERLDRSVLPIAEPRVSKFTELDVRDTTAPQLFAVTAPENAPNVLVVLVDDLGFAGTSTFGGPVKTPTFEQIAKEGVYYNNFHTTAVCSPTRAALKS